MAYTWTRNGMAYEDFRWRFPPCPEPIFCEYCLHKQRGLTCDAFPEGIPDELIQRGEHKTPYKGDGGIRFEQAPEKPNPPEKRYILQSKTGQYIRDCKITELDDLHYKVVKFEREGNCMKFYVEER